MSLLSPIPETLRAHLIHQADQPTRGLIEDVQRWGGKQRMVHAHRRSLLGDISLDFRPIPGDPWALHGDPLTNRRIGLSASAIPEFGLAD